VRFGAPSAIIEGVFKTLRPKHPHLYNPDEEFAFVKMRVETEQVARAWDEHLQKDEWIAAGKLEQERIREAGPPRRPGRARKPGLGIHGEKQTAPP
jgi:hypothetical protein